MGRDVMMWFNSDLTLEISIHAPAWGATNTKNYRRACREYFNSRARMGRDQPNNSKNASDVISIHAPAWGATISFQNCSFWN